MSLADHSGPSKIVDYWLPQISPVTSKAMFIKAYCGEGEVKGLKQEISWDWAQFMLQYFLNE